MYEDFSYIADDQFLSNYWWQEKIASKNCRGQGKLNTESEENTISRPLCEQTGKVHRHQENKVPVV